MTPWLLHVSDPHLGDVSPGQDQDDSKEIFESQQDRETTQRVFERTLKRLRWFVEEHGKPDVVVVSGDLTYRSRPGGFKRFAELLKSHDDLLPPRSRIVVVPGNHDVVWDKAPGTRTRYAGFLGATRDCAIPLLDGVDFDPETGVPKSTAPSRPHVVETEDFVVVPVNTSNYCGVFTDRRGAWTKAEWEKRLGQLSIREAVLAQVARLRQHDMARVSRWQVEALSTHLEELGLLAPDGRVRIAALHHQLLPVSTREERKTFESLVNLGLVRQMLSEFAIDVVLHGHKHESAMFWDSVPHAKSVSLPARRMLVIASPGQFKEGDPTMRALALSGPRAARNLNVTTFAGAGSHTQKSRVADETRVPLWQAAMEREPHEPLVVGGESAHLVYSRLRALFELDESRPRHNLVCEISNPVDAEVVPPEYPRVGTDAKQAWFDDLVSWWQRERSVLVDRDILPFNHGSRIYRRWDNQVERAARMLNERDDSSRAFIQLIGPEETGRYAGDTRDLDEGSFPAFVLAEFSIGKRDGKRVLDCTGYFRKQEMQYWWPINLAELSRLQEAVRKRVTGKPPRGSLVTVSAVALWDEKVPRVAVPEADRLIESRDRMWKLAAGAAFPTNAPEAARGEWERLLSDLAAEGRESPPRPAIGLRWLLSEIERLAPLAPSPELDAVRDALETLCEQYDSGTGKLNASATKLVRKEIAVLRKAVDEVLPPEDVGPVA